jgi:adenylosuccinate lyase
MRYSNEHIDNIWSESAIASSRVAIEWTWLESLWHLGLIEEPPAEKTTFQTIVARAAEIERKTNHDVASLVIAMEEHLIGLGYKDHRMVHFGLTSSDICDTSLSIAYRESFEFLKFELRKLIRGLAMPKGETIARTHGADTGLRLPLSLRLSRMAHELDDVIEGISRLSFYGKLSGPIGRCDAFGLHSSCESVALSALSLSTHPASTQVVPRHVYADYHMKLAILGKILSRIANSIRLSLLAGDISLSKVIGEIGSSSMPHKVNPWQLERVSGLSRMLDSHAMAALSNIDLWLERDISHSCVERVNPPASFNYLILMSNDILGYVKRITTVEKPESFNSYKSLNERLIREDWNSREECHREVESESARYSGNVQ